MTLTTDFTKSDVLRVHDKKAAYRSFLRREVGLAASIPQARLRFVEHAMELFCFPEDSAWEESFCSHLEDIIKKKNATVGVSAQNGMLRFNLFDC